MTSAVRARPAPSHTPEDTLEDALESLSGGPEEDADDEFPAAICDRLTATGLSDHYVPVEWGGALADHELLLRLLRTVARRDLTAAVAHGKTYLGSACVWAAGRPDQARSVAGAVRGGEPVAWALSEPEHGADLINGSMTATPGAGGYRLEGAKWPVNNATRSRLLTVLARTGEAGTARSHSLVLVDKDQLAPGCWRALPKVATHGIRGADISGIAFEGAHVPDSALLGPPGSGLETVLGTLQLTRTICAALSLGAGEHALRLAGRFTAERIIARRALIERAYPGSVLARSAGLLAAAEAAGLVGARSIHALTGELSVTSAVVKALAPSLVDSAIGELAELLGARSFLTGVEGYGAFQKIGRDHQVVAVFDGSTPVNRAALIHQFPRLVKGFAGTTVAAGLDDALATGGPLPDLDRTRLTMLSRPGCSLVQSLPLIVAATATAAAGGPDGLAAHAIGLGAAAEQVLTRMAGVRPGARPPMAAYELAAAYELCYAGAACLHLWARGSGRHPDEPLWQNGLWVRAAVRALRERLSSLLRLPAPEPVPADDDLDRQLARCISRAGITGGPITPFGRATARHAGPLEVEHAS